MPQIKDNYCWKCHKNGAKWKCCVATCARTYHYECRESDLCTECRNELTAKTSADTTGAVKWLDRNVDQLCQVLNEVLIDMKNEDPNRLFTNPVSPEAHPEYSKLIVNPMYLSKVEEKIRNKTYVSTNSFLADIKWLYHNCVVYNTGFNEHIIPIASKLLSIAAEECRNIDLCADCSYNSYKLGHKKYFTAICRRPHTLVWAKLNDHPYWPGKIMDSNQARKELLVHFFGLNSDSKHEIAWVKEDSCLMMSLDYPGDPDYSSDDIMKNKFLFKAIVELKKHLVQLNRFANGLFRLYDRHSKFSIDKLYSTQIPVKTLLSSSVKTTVKRSTNKCKVKPKVKPKIKLKHNISEKTVENPNTLNIDLTDECDSNVITIDSNSDTDDESPHKKSNISVNSGKTSAENLLNFCNNLNKNKLEFQTHIPSAHPSPSRSSSSNQLIKQLLNKSSNDSGVEGMAITTKTTFSNQQNLEILRNFRISRNSQQNCLTTDDKSFDQKTVDSNRLVTTDDIGSSEPVPLISANTTNFMKQYECSVCSELFNRRSKFDQHKTLHLSRIVTFQVVYTAI